MKRLLVVFAAALALRAGMALLTEWKPLFPPYYYMDAQLMDATAVDMMGAWREHRDFATALSTSNRFYGAYAALVYTVVGHHPIAVKLLNSCLGALSVLLVGLAVAPALGETAGLATAWLVALWPSHVFFTSQNVKDAPTLMFLWGALACASPLLAEGALTYQAGAGLAASLVLLGFMRSYLLVVAACAVAVAGLAARKRTAAAAAALALAALPAYLFLAHLLYSGPLRPPEFAAGDPTSHEALLVQTFDARNQRADDRYIRPLSPAGITRTRAIRQESEIQWAETHGHREVGTLLFPSLDLATWWDVASFLPKGAFYVLFMPLPGLYPSAGKLGRVLASLENLLLLALAVASLWAVSRRRLGAAAVMLLCYFFAMTAGSALLEFDLGSATRHKVGYFPALLAFGIAWILSRAKADAR